MSVIILRFIVLMGSSVDNVEEAKGIIAHRQFMKEFSLFKSHFRGILSNVRFEYSWFDLDGGLESIVEQAQRTVKSREKLVKEWLAENPSILTET